jgi:hypothetical protein
MEARLYGSQGWLPLPLCRDAVLDFVTFVSFCSTMNFAFYLCVPAANLAHYAT